MSKTSASSSTLTCPDCFKYRLKKHTHTQHHDAEIKRAKHLRADVALLPCFQNLTATRYSTLQATPSNLSSDAIQNSMFVLKDTGVLLMLLIFAVLLLFDKEQAWG